MININLSDDNFNNLINKSNELTINETTESNKYETLKECISLRNKISNLTQNSKQSDKQEKINSLHESIKELDIKILKILNISLQAFDELHRCGPLLQEIISKKLSGTQIHDLLHKSKEKAIALQKLNLNITPPDLERLCQFIELIKMTESLNGEKTFRKKKYQLPATIKIDHGEVHIITKRVLGKGAYKKAKVSGKYEKEIRIVWGTPNLPKTADLAQREKIFQSFLAEAAHEQKIYKHLEGLENIASHLGTQIYMDKTEKSEKSAILMVEYQTTLDKVLAESSLTRKQIKHIASGILKGLEGMHSKDVTHQDLKPENIFINIQKDPKGDPSKDIYTPFLGDMGRAVILPNLIKKYGTEGYLSPEIISRQRQKHRGQLKEDPYAFHEDIFAAGEIFYELLYKKPSEWAAEQKQLGTILVRGPKNDEEASKLNIHSIHLQERQAEPVDKNSFEYAIWRMLDPDADTRSTIKEAQSIIASDTKAKLI